MQRHRVQVVRVRIADLLVGDVINAELDNAAGWFTIDEIRRLPSGELNATNMTMHTSVMGHDDDLVGFQVRSSFDAPAPLTSAEPAPAVSSN